MNLALLLISIAAAAARQHRDVTADAQYHGMTSLSISSQFPFA